MTKAKTLIFLEDDIATATLCLSEAIQIARINISEEAAKDLVREFEKARQEKNPSEGSFCKRKSVRKGKCFRKRKSRTAFAAVNRALHGHQRRLDFKRSSEKIRFAKRQSGDHRPR